MLSPFGPVSAPTPESLPDDPAVRTRNGLYATRAQAQALDASAGGDSVWVDVDGREPSAIDLAEGHVAGMMAANNLAADAPVFVTGNDAAAAARGVDRLSAQGLTRVFLVTR